MATGSRRAALSSILQVLFIVVLLHRVTNPADSTIACAVDGRIFVHAFGGEEIVSFDVEIAAGVKIDHLAWNFDGSLLVATAQDRKIRVVDPRRRVVLAVQIFF